LVPDTIPISHKDGLKDKACNPEQFAWSNILKPTHPTKTHVKEEASSISDSTEKGIGIILQELQYLRTSFKRLEAENESHMEALNNIEQVSCDSACRYL
jgi:HAMP domain-containing protein